MADEITTINQFETATPQLTQAQGPLEEAAITFSRRDANGQIPIILVPEQKQRIRNEYVQIGFIVLAAGIIGGIIFGNGLVIFLAIVASIVLFLLGLYRSFYVRIPEGASALLVRGGRYTRTIGSGTHVVPPWILVSHVVSRREIPFNAPIVQGTSFDNVRVDVDTVLTFNIADPYAFVYNISADDFDEVFQAAAQDALRGLVRKISAEKVINLKGSDLAELRDALAEHMNSYGVDVKRVSVTYAMPTADFMRSLESKQLAIIQREEHKERQILAQRLQEDAEILARQQVMAEVEREKEALRLQIQKAEAHREVIEVEAQAEELRLSKLEARLQANPTAAKYELEMARLKVAQALAGNSKAVLQLGTADDIVRAFVMRDLLEEQLSEGSPGESAEKQEEVPRPRASSRRRRAPAKSESQGE